MLQRLNTSEEEETDPKKAATERARQLHARYRAFMNGQFGNILEQERSEGGTVQTQPSGKGKHKKLGGAGANNKEDDPTQGADTIISYIRDGNIGKATTAIMSHGVAPVNDDTIKQVTELLTPMEPRPLWTDTRANPTSRARIPAQLDPNKLGANFRSTPKRIAADIYGWTYEHLQVLIGEKKQQRRWGAS